MSTLPAEARLLLREGKNRQTKQNRRRKRERNKSFRKRCKGKEKPVRRTQEYKEFDKVTVYQTTIYFYASCYDVIHQVSIFVRLLKQEEIGMTNRTDFINVGVKEQLCQQAKNQIGIVRAVLWALLGFVVGLGNMMLEISPFGAALCAAAPQKYLLPAALGSASGSLLLADLTALGGVHTITFQYAAAVLLICIVRLSAKKHSDGKIAQALEHSALGTPILAFSGMILPSLAVDFAVGINGYSLMISLAEAVLAGACSYFLGKSLRVFSLGQGLFALKRADFVSVALTACVLIVSLSNITVAGISLGRLTASFLVLLCALLGKERWGATAGILCGAAVSFAMFPKMQLLGVYALAGLAAGAFCSLGKFGCAGVFAMTFGAMSVMTVPMDPLPLLYETLIATVALMLCPKNRLQSLQNQLFRCAVSRGEQTVRRLMLERLEESSCALREIAYTTQEISRRIDRTRAGSLEQVYDDAVDRVCMRCGLKTRCWQQEYSDSINVFSHLTPVLRQNGSVCEEDFIYPLSARCTRRDQLAKQINAGYRELTAKEGMSRKVARVRSVVTDQFEGLAGLLGDLAREMCGISQGEEQMTARVSDYLEQIRLPVKRLSCYRDREGRSFIHMDLEPYRCAGLKTETLSDELSRVCDCEIDLPQKTEMTLHTEQGEQRVTRFVFREKAEYQAEYANSQHICQGYRMCGDACRTFTDRRSIAHIILSDGMGSGSAAAVDSNMTVSLITKLIDAGVGYQAALKIVNSALLVKSGEESLSTIDITAVNLYTGQAKFYKAGAAPTYIRRGKRAGIVESTSLPAGILTAVEFEQSSVKLSDGDLVVMVSDGATASGGDWIKAVVEHFPQEGNLQALCDDIASTARLRRNDNHDDDITVAACRIRRVRAAVE